MHSKWQYSILHQSKHTMPEAKTRRRPLPRIDRSHVASKSPLLVDEQAVAVFGWDAELTQHAITRAIRECTWSPRMTVSEATKGGKLTVFQFDLLRYQSAEEQETFTIASGRRSDNNIFILGGEMISYDTVFSRAYASEWMRFLIT